MRLQASPELRVLRRRTTPGRPLQRLSRAVRALRQARRDRGIGVAGRAGLWQLGHLLQRPARAAQPLRRPRRPGRGDGQQGPEAHRGRSTGAPAVAIADKALFDQGRKKLTDAMRSHDITKPKGGLNTYGTAVLINILNEAGGLPTRNFSSGRFEGAAKIAGEAIFEGNKQRPGKELYNHACSPGCIIQCSNTWYAAGRQRDRLLRGVRVRLGLGRQLRHRQPGRHRRDDPAVQRLRPGHHRGRRHHRRGHGRRRDPPSATARAPSS